MSQAGKILHLYVEVRSVAEEEGQEPVSVDEGPDQPMLRGPDLLPQSQRASSHPSPSPAMSPGLQHKSRGSNQSLGSSKTPSRHSVSFQLHTPDATGSPTQHHRQSHRQSLPYDSQLLQVITPGHKSPGHHDMLVRARSSDIDPYQGRMPISLSPTSSRRLTALSTPASGCRSYEGSGLEREDGKRSFVTFSYVEKASVQNVESPHRSACQSEPQNPFNRVDKWPLPAHLQKRLSDPVWYDCWQASGGSNPKLHCSSSGLSPQGSLCLRRATLDSVARDTTNRALEEFGSPELRRRLAGHIAADRSPSLPRHYQSTHYRSLSGSPVLPRSARTLPPGAQLLDPDWGHSYGSMNGLPRSPASDQLSTHARYIYHTVAPTSTVRSHNMPPQSQQRHWLGDESPRLSTKFHPPLPAGRPTDIQHEIPAIMIPSSSQATNNQPRTSPHANSRTRHNVNNSQSANDSNTSLNANDCMHYSATDSPRVSSKMYYKPSGYTSRDSNIMSPPNGRRSASPDKSTELACRLAVEANTMSTVFMDHRTPSPTLSQLGSSRSESPRLGHSSPRESQPYATLHGHSSPEQPPSESTSQDQRRKTDRSGPSSRLGQVSPLLSQKGISLPASPAAPARLHRVVASRSPVLDPCLQVGSLQDKETPTLHRHQPPQYTGEQGSPGMERRQYDPLFDRMLRDSPELVRRPFFSQSTEVPVSWTSRHMQWRERGSSPDAAEPYEENQRQSTDRVCTPTKEEYHKRDGRGGGGGGGEGGGGGTLMQGYQGVFLSSSGGREGRERGDNQDHSGALGTSSQSSSGVTGSLGESCQPERDDCLSPETSSQSSQRSNDTGETASGMQSDSGSSVPGPSLRSQKIARAKWEFLFGPPEEDDHWTKDVPSTVPPTSESPTPPSSLLLKPISHRKGQVQRLSHHKVQQVEVELLNPVTLVGSMPKTGIIRRTLKYSETDLDAVPLRCYRETDLDEVMREEAEAEAVVAALAEAEEDMDVDSAFGSNRSVLGTSASSTSPMESSLYLRTDGEEEEEGLEEEGVVSWASVRMQGYKKRQCATKEEDEVYSLVLKGPLEPLTDLQTALKSPISVTSPRCTSDGNLDSFSRHFENIIESHRAKGTSYSSLDSVDLMTSGPPIFTFDLPTLTPEIQSQICESAKQIIELSFAPLAKPESPGLSETSRSETTLPTSGLGLKGGSKDDLPSRGTPRSERDSWRRANLKDGFRKANSVPSLHSSSREKPGHRPPELLYPQADVAERLALGSTDNLTNGTKADLQAAKRLANRLFIHDGFKKSDVARHLSKNNDFSRMVAEEYLSNFSFTGLSVDQALRAFLREFALMGETQERERVLSHFSRRYLQCNPNTIPIEDSVHTLTCAVMLLNTDLHGHNIGKRMSCSQFIHNLEGLNDGKDFPKELLKALYSSIRAEKLQWTIDNEELRKSMAELADVRTDSASHTMKRMGRGANPLLAVAQQSDAMLYKNGFLVRKVHADSDGKRTPRGKRGWRSFYAMLNGLVLYLQKGEYRPDRQLSDEDLKNAVSIHHSLAMRAADYSKRPNVFYLRTADWRVFLFQAPNAEQMQSWITRINTVAAMFSAPPFPAAIGSQKRFSRPLLPGSSSKLSQEEQVKSHETRFRAISSELADLKATPLDRKMKGRELEEHKLRSEYLEFEKTRYGTYAMLLRAKLHSGDEDLSAFEARLFGDGSLQRAHSSPILPQESSSSQASSCKEKGLSSKTTTSSKEGSKNKSSSSKRSEPQRQSYKQAVKQ